MFSPFGGTNSSASASFNDHPTPLPPSVEQLEMATHQKEEDNKALVIELRQELSRSHTKNADLNAKTNELNSELAKCTGALGAVQNQLKMTTQELEELRQTTSQQLEGVRSTAANLQTTNEHLQGELNRTREDLRAREASIEELRATLHIQTQKANGIEPLEKQLKEARREVEGAKQGFAVMQRQGKESENTRKALDLLLHAMFEDLHETLSKESSNVHIFLSDVPKSVEDLLQGTLHATPGPANAQPDSFLANLPFAKEEPEASVVREVMHSSGMCKLRAALTDLRTNSQKAGHQFRFLAKNLDDCRADCLTQQGAMAELRREKEELDGKYTKQRRECEEERNANQSLAEDLRQSRQQWEQERRALEEERRGLEEGLSGAKRESISHQQKAADRLVALNPIVLQLAQFSFEESTGSDDYNSPRSASPTATSVADHQSRLSALGNANLTFESLKAVLEDSAQSVKDLEQKWKRRAMQSQKRGDSQELQLREMATLLEEVKRSAKLREAEQEEIYRKTSEEERERMRAKAQQTEGELNRRLDKCEAEYASSQLQFTELKLAHTQKCSEYEILEHELRTKRKEIESLTAQLTSYQSQLEDEKNESKNLKEQVALHYQESQHFSQQFHASETRLEMMETNLKTVSQRADELTANLHSSEQREQSSTVQVQQCQFQNQELTNKLSASTKTVEGLRTQVAEMQAASSQQLGQMQALSDEKTLVEERAGLGERQLQQHQVGLQLLCRAWLHQLKQLQQIRVAKRYMQVNAGHQAYALNACLKELNRLRALLEPPPPAIPPGLMESGVEAGGGQGGPATNPSSMASPIFAPSELASPSPGHMALYAQPSRGSQWSETPSRLFADSPRSYAPQSNPKAHLQPPSAPASFARPPAFREVALAALCCTRLLRLAKHIKFTRRANLYQPPICMGSEPLGVQPFHTLNFRQELFSGAGDEGAEQPPASYVSLPSDFPTRLPEGEDAERTELDWLVRLLKSTCRSDALAGFYVEPPTDHSGHGRGGQQDWQLGREARSGRFLTRGAPLLDRSPSPTRKNSSLVNFGVQEWMDALPVFQTCNRLRVHTLAPSVRGLAEATGRRIGESDANVRSLTQSLQNGASRREIEKAEHLQSVDILTKSQEHLKENLRMLNSEKEGLVRQIQEKEAVIRESVHRSDLLEVQRQLRDAQERANGLQERTSQLSMERDSLRNSKSFTESELAETKEALLNVTKLREQTADRLDRVGKDLQKTESALMEVRYELTEAKRETSEVRIHAQELQRMKESRDREYTTLQIDRQKSEQVYREENCITHQKNEELGKRNSDLKQELEQEKYRVITLEQVLMKEKEGRQEVERLIQEHMTKTRETECTNALQAKNIDDLREKLMQTEISLKAARDAQAKLQEERIRAAQQRYNAERDLGKILVDPSAATPPAPAVPPISASPQPGAYPGARASPAPSMGPQVAPTGGLAGSIPIGGLSAMAGGTTGAETPISHLQMQTTLDSSPRGPTGLVNYGGEVISRASPPYQPTNPYAVTLPDDRGRSSPEGQTYQSQWTHSSYVATTTNT